MPALLSTFLPARLSAPLPARLPALPRRSGHRAGHPFPRLARLLAGLLAAGLASCATEPAPVAAGPVAATLFDDVHVGPPSDPVRAEDVFRMTPAMQDYVRHEVLPLAHRLGVRQALTDALYSRTGLRLDYEASMTRNAAQAFEAHEGNCLSLVIMTAAFAKALGLNVTYQQVVTDDLWSRAGGLFFVSGHVNLQLERSLADQVDTYDHVGTYTIDFMPSADSASLRAYPITEARILSMYMNNRAAEALVAGQLDDAYWRAREAVRIDPGFLTAYNTLGVIYQRRADVPHAEAAFHYVLVRQPDNVPVLGNEAEALHLLGREPEAQAARARLAVIEPHPPFYYFTRGQAAYKAGDLKAARVLFKQELQRDPDYHEFHFWLAITDFGLGRLDEARDEMSIAMADAVKRTDRDLYAAKLDRLKTYQQRAQ